MSTEPHDGRHGAENPLAVRVNVLDGVVEHGDKRGRLLGFPTANVSGEVRSLDDGVWAGTVQLDYERGGPVFAAAISLGRRPTYYDETGPRLIEAFLLDFNDQIYDQAVRVRFLRFLRPQLTFADSAQLVHQLHHDVAEVRTWALDEDLLPGRSAPPRRQPFRWSPHRRRGTRERNEAWEALEQRRNELVSQAVLAYESGTPNHAWVAAWTGLPIGYLQHRYPSLEAMESAAPEGRHDVNRASGPPVETGDDADPEPQGRGRALPS